MFQFGFARLWFLLLILLFVPFLFVVLNPAPFRQKSWQVVTREPGERHLGAPRPISTEAFRDLEFAWLSESAYQKTPAAATDTKFGECPDPGVSLRKAGWTLWTQFPDAELREKISQSHLRVEVWENTSRPAVVVAFGGTVFNNRMDWKSNLRWFIPKHNDEYTAVIQDLVSPFLDAFLKRLRDPDGRLLAHATLYATGHSLGGGLAQEFAYSLPINSGVPRVTQVFAFDPSPVTGFYSVDAATRDANVQTLAIDRIYERGEILALARSLTSFIVPPSANAPVIRQVRYNLFARFMPITGHSMTELACKLNDAVQKSSSASTSR
jgi:hypothetical protein